MVVLKKIKGSTLIETLMATVLVVVIFVLASGILNNLVSSAVASNTMEIDAHFMELRYLHQHQQLEFPFTERFQNWDILAYEIKEQDQTKVVLEATNLNSLKTIIRTYNETAQ